jgi:hypothetical protein
VVEVEGLTVFVMVVVKLTSLYQVTEPVAQFAESVELCPEQIVAGLAEIAVGAFGVILVVETLAVVVAVQPFASVAVIVYEPAVRLLNVPDGL